MGLFAEPNFNALIKCKSDFLKGEKHFIKNGNECLISIKEVVPI